MRLTALLFSELRRAPHLYSEPDAVEYNKDSEPQHDLIICTKPWES